MAEQLTSSSPSLVGETAAPAAIPSEAVSTVIPKEPASMAIPAESAAPITEFETKTVATIAFAHGVHDTYSGFLPALLPFLIDKFALSNTRAGVLTLFYQVPSISQPLFGYFADKRNLRLFVCLAPAITGAVMTTLGILPSAGVMYLLLILAGLSSASIHAVGPGVTGKFSGKRIGYGMSFWMIGGELGASMGALILVTALEWLELNQLPVLMIAGILVSIFLWFRLKDINSTQPLTAEKVVPKDRFRKIGKVMLPLFVLLLSRAMATVSLSTFFPTFLKSEGASNWVSGAGLTLLWVSGILGSYLSGNLSDRTGRRRILAVSIIFTPIFMLLFLQVEGWFQVLLIVLIGMFSMSIFPVVMAIVLESFTDDRSFATGIFQMVNFLTTAMMVPVVGRLADLYSFRFTFQLGALILPLGLLALLMMPKKAKQKQHSI